MSSASDCQSQLQSSVNLYWGVVGASLGLTFLNLIVVRICLRNYNRRNPQVAAKIHFGAGGIKILLGILILTVFHPTCPSGCTCYEYSGIAPSYAYGMIVLVCGKNLVCSLLERFCIYYTLSFTCRFRLSECFGVLVALIGSRWQLKRKGP